MMVMVIVKVVIIMSIMWVLIIFRMGVRMVIMVVLKKTMIILC